jgi:hypothetical protein
MVFLCLIIAEAGRIVDNAAVAPPVQQLLLILLRSTTSTIQKFCILYYENDLNFADIVGLCIFLTTGDITLSFL